jgi:hypothetical protein
MSDHSAENDAHKPTELADIFGGYLCTCGESWTRFHDEQTRVTSPATAQKCNHAHVESWRKFDGTLLWRCLDCGADSRDDTTVIPAHNQGTVDDGDADDCAYAEDDH